MSTRGIENVVLETHNWGKAAKFFQTLGYALDFETDHNSGQLSSATGPTVFIVEVPEDRETRTRLVLTVPDEAGFELDPSLEVVTPFEDTHWGTREMTVRDPDGRIWVLSTRRPA
jgi:hypothetical protein